MRAARLAAEKVFTSQIRHAERIRIVRIITGKQFPRLQRFAFWRSRCIFLMGGRSQAIELKAGLTAQLSKTAQHVIRANKSAC